VHLCTGALNPLFSGLWTILPLDVGHWPLDVLFSVLWPHFLLDFRFFDPLEFFRGEGHSIGGFYFLWFYRTYSTEPKRFGELLRRDVSGRPKVFSGRKPFLSEIRKPLGK